MNRFPDPKHPRRRFHPRRHFQLPVTPNNPHPDSDINRVGLNYQWLAPLAPHEHCDDISLFFGLPALLSLPSPALPAAPVPEQGSPGRPCRHRADSAGSCLIYYEDEDLIKVLGATPIFSISRRTAAHCLSYRAVTRMQRSPRAHIEQSQPLQLRSVQCRTATSVSP